MRQPDVTEGFGPGPVTLSALLLSLTLTHPVSHRVQQDLPDHDRLSTPRPRATRTDPGPATRAVLEALLAQAQGLELG